MNRLVVLALAAMAAACGPSFPFQPSNLPASFAFAATDSLVFGSSGCGPRAELDTDRGEIRCYGTGGGVYDVPFAATVTDSITQSDGTKLMVFAGRGIRIDSGTEVQLRGTRPAVLLSLGDISVGGFLTAQNGIAQYTGEGGGASEPSGTLPAKGLGPGGGFAVSGAGSGGGSYCGAGGKGGSDTGGGTTGANGGATYGNAELTPLRGGSSGGLQFNHSGAGGGAVQLVAAGTVTIAAGGSINMGGQGGGWFGEGGGSGGAILIEANAITVAGNVAANGGGGGGGGTGAAQDGASARASWQFAEGGQGSGPSNYGGYGASGGDLNAIDAPSVDGQPGGGGGGAGWIRFNTTQSGSFTITLPGTVSPSVGTACASVGSTTPRR